MRPGIRITCGASPGPALDATGRAPHIPRRDFANSLANPCGRVVGPAGCPFAEHARLHRDIKAEKAALERTVVQERKSTASKALIGMGVVGALLAGAAAW